MLPENPDVTPFIAYCLETEIKYEGYIKRQQSQIGAVKRQEETPIPEDFDYAPLTGLRLEAREKLAKIRPRSVGQAARIPGVGRRMLPALRWSWRNGAEVRERNKSYD